MFIKALQKSQSAQRTFKYVDNDMKMEGIKS